MSILRLQALYQISESSDWTRDNVGAATWCEYIFSFS